MTTTALPPLCTELAYVSDSAVYFEAVRTLPRPVFLDSAGTDCAAGRFDIISADPFISLETWADITEISDRQQIIKRSTEDPFSLLQREMAPYQHARTDLPFSGGAITYFAYDLGRRIERLPSTAINAEQIPDMAVGLYDWAVVIDHQQQQAWLLSHGHDPETHQSWQQLEQRFRAALTHTPTSSSFTVAGELSGNLSERGYQHAFDAIQNYIREGDCYQVNLAKRFAINAEGDPWAAYLKLRQLNAAPFSAYMDLPSVTLMSSSPERLLQVTDQRVETKPIKGTRPRDRNNAIKDQQLAEDLQHSLKDRAENLMIVDLLRNDLGKVCEPGSISVPAPFALESFATVHHLVSTITGQLSASETAVSLMRACFPGGSITGAPKLRAMEIIEELEPHRRGAYCGSIAYIGFDGDMDSNILIRTLVFNQNTLRFWAGGGIVADSEAAAEYQEVNDKAAAMFTLVEQLRQ
jgi:para-aminobenzoate synthetase component 1